MRRHEHIHVDSFSSGRLLNLSDFVHSNLILFFQDARDSAGEEVAAADDATSSSSEDQIAMTVTAIPPSASGSAESLTTPTTTVVETPMSTTDSRPASMKASVATVLSNPLLSATPETKLSEVPIPS